MLNLLYHRFIYTCHYRWDLCQNNLNYDLPYLLMHSFATLYHPHHPPHTQNSKRIRNYVTDTRRLLYSSNIQMENMQTEFLKSLLQNVTIGLNLIITKLYDNTLLLTICEKLSMLTCRATLLFHLSCHVHQGRPLRYHPQFCLSRHKIHP